jgi:LacI family transcriptional regulator
MAQKIRETAKRLNYQPDQIARSLKSKKTRTIGLVVADISNPFFGNLARIIEDEASQNKYTLIIGSSDEDPEKMDKILDVMVSRQVDGFILVPTQGSYKRICLLKQNNIPFVLIDRCYENISTNYVIIDNFKASVDAMHFFLGEKGYKKVGIISYKSNLNHFKGRIKGYIKALTDFSIKPDINLIKKVDYYKLKQQMQVAISNLIEKEHAEAIYFTTNTLAMEGLKYIFNLGIKIPEELDILAFDHAEAYHFFHYPLPRIIQPIPEMGIKAVKLLIDQMENESDKIYTVCMKAKLEVDSF